MAKTWKYAIRNKINQLKQSYKTQSAYETNNITKNVQINEKVTFGIERAKQRDHFSPNYVKYNKKCQKEKR